MHRSLVAALLILLCAFAARAQTPRYYIEHKVRWMENIYTIARKYKADPTTVLEYNGITANEVRRGIILRIPVVLDDNRNIVPSDTLHTADSTNTPFQWEPNYYECTEHQPSPGTLHRISLMLPFHLNEPQPNNQFLDFYFGLLLAVADLKDEGMGIRLSLYDEGSTNLSALVQSGALSDEEFVIGPVYAQDIFNMLNHTQGQHVKIISPLDRQTESAAYGNPNFFQVNASFYNQQANLIQCLPSNPGMVWLFCEASGVDQELVDMTKDILREHRIIYREFVHKVAKDQDITSELALMLVQGQNNHVIVASTDEAFVADVLRSLYLVHTRRNCPVTLYGNARWRNFENVDLNYYHSMNLHLSVTNYVDYQNTEIKRFLSRYRALYRTEPSDYAYQGYDVGCYFLRALHIYGPYFQYCIEQGVSPALPLQSNFRFQKIGQDGGYINTDTRIIQYLPNYRIEMLR